MPNPQCLVITKPAPKTFITSVSKGPLLQIHLIDRYQIHPKRIHDQVHDRVVLDLQEDSSGLCRIIAHHHLVGELEVLDAVEKSGNNIRAKRGEWNIK